MSGPLKLTTQAILTAAYEATNAFGEYVDKIKLPPEVLESEDYKKFVHHILLEAANPNGAMIVAKFHDEQAGNLIRSGIYTGSVNDLLPFTQLPKEVQTVKLFFRSAVVALSPYWTHH